MSKKSKKQIMKEIEERLKKEEEEREAARQLEIEKNRKKELMKEKLRIQMKEREIRNEMLPKVCEIFEVIKITKIKNEISQREEQDWIMYLKCDGKPDPTNLDDMNYYLYKWKTETESDFIENTIIKFDEVIKLLGVLNQYIEKPLQTPSHEVALWEDMRQRFYKELLTRLDNATYNIIRNIEKNMKNIDNKSAQLVKDTEYFSLGLWTKYQIPEPCASLEEIDVVAPMAEFPEINITVKAPYQLVFDNFVIRLIWFKYDQYSCTSKTWKTKRLPAEYRIDFHKFNVNEYEEKEKLKQEYEEERKRKKDKVKTKKVERSSKQSSSLSASRSSISQVLVKDATESDSSETLLPLSVKDSSSSIFAQLSDSSTGLKRPSEMIAMREEIIKKSFMRYCVMNLDLVRQELNLREFMILGGAYNLDFLESLPQPITLKDSTTLMISYGDQAIKHIPIDSEINSITKRSTKGLREKYHSKSISQVDPTHDDEEAAVIQDRKSSTEDRKSKSITRTSSKLQSKEENEGVGKETIFKKENEGISLLRDGNELEGKVEREPENQPERYSTVEYDPIHFKPLISIKLPNHILWFQPPCPVLWDQRRRFWTKDGLYNVEFDDEKQVLEFRLGKLLAPIGLAVKRYIHLPFIYWKLEAEFTDMEEFECIAFTLCSNNISVVFKIKDDEVCLYSFSTSIESDHILKDIIGTYYEPKKLIKIMKNRGVDIFSDYDAFLYINNAVPKQLILENHTYMSIAILCRTHNFLWSKWNSFVNSNSIVLNFQEIILCEIKKHYFLTLITLDRATFLDCDESWPEFSDSPKRGQVFNPDLYSLALSTSSFMATAKIKNFDVSLTYTVYKMLKRTHILSYS